MLFIKLIRKFSCFLYPLEHFKWERKRFFPRRLQLAEDNALRGRDASFTHLFSIQIPHIFNQFV